MKKLNIEAAIIYVMLVLGIFLLGFGWVDAERRITELNSHAVELQAQVDAANAAYDAAVDQKDNALVQVQAEKNLIAKKMERQFYRGVYASAIVISKGKGLPLEAAVKAATNFVKGAIEHKAYEMYWPGVDPVPAQTKDQKNA